jgi:hypothetical protein
MRPIQWYMGVSFALEDGSAERKADFTLKSFHTRSLTLLASPSFRGLAGQGALCACLAITGASDKVGLLLS